MARCQAPIHPQLLVNCYPLRRSRTEAPFHDLLDEQIEGSVEDRREVTIGLGMSH